MILLAINFAALVPIIRRYDAALLPKDKREPAWRLSPHESASPPVTVYDQHTSPWLFHKTTLFGMRHEAEIAPKPAQGLYVPMMPTLPPGQYDTVYVFYDMGCAVAVLGHSLDRDRMETYEKSFYAPRTLMHKIGQPCYVWHCSPPVNTHVDGTYMPATTYLERHVALRLLANLSGNHWMFDVVDEFGSKLGRILADMDGLGYLPRHTVSARVGAAGCFARHCPTGFHFFGRKDAEGSTRYTELGRIVDGTEISLRVLTGQLPSSRVPAVVTMLDSILDETDLDLPYRWPRAFMELNAFCPIDIAVSRVLMTEPAPPGI